jgi:hypothetical protein
MLTTVQDKKLVRRLDMKIIPVRRRQVGNKDSTLNVVKTHSTPVVDLPLPHFIPG